MLWSTSASGPPRVLLVVVGGIVGRIVVGKNRVGLVVVEKFGYIAFVVEVAHVEMQLMLGDGFMKMEKMKIDMAREIARMRMESEMKQNQLILESQKQIVDAFVKGLIETRKRPRGETVADS
ncbi:hypothetical protein Tco_0954154 [Tanacetum coccineum]|uniref:Uncharacterized protein n=1 Tax=Tanacetum coccineum TaxID=301880 RepID=A0ABQ5E2W9_9ASTR